MVWSDFGNQIMSRINLHSMQILASVAATRSFSKTAIELNMTPSAVSKRIAELETRFGTPLVIRRNTGVELTAAGNIVVRCSEDVMERVAGMSREVAELLLQQHGEIRIMSNTTAILLGLLEDIGQFRKSHPGIRISVSEGLSREVATSVKNNRIDVGICVYTDAVRGLSHFPYRQTELVVVLRRDHALASRDVLTPNDLKPYSIVWSPPIEIEGRGAWQPSGDNTVDLSVRSFDVVLRSVRENVGLAIVPRIAAAESLQTDLLMIRLDATQYVFELVVCYDPSIHSDPPTQQLIAWLGSRAKVSGNNQLPA